MKDLNSQKGMSLSNILLLSPLFILFIYGAILLLPVYYDYYIIDSVLSSVDANDKRMMYPANVKETIERRFHIEGVKSVRAKDILVKRTKKGMLMKLEHTYKVPYMGNIEFNVHFNKEYLLGESSS